MGFSNSGTNRGSWYSETNVGSGSGSSKSEMNRGSGNAGSLFISSLAVTFEIALDIMI